MAWTQADVDALKAKIARAVKATASGDKSVTNQDMSQMLMALQAMEAEVSSGTSGESLGRCTIASLPRV